MSTAAGYTTIPANEPAEHDPDTHTLEYSRSPKSSETTPLSSAWEVLWLKWLGLSAVLLVGLCAIYSQTNINTAALAPVESPIVEPVISDLAQASRPGTPHRVGSRRFRGLYSGCSSSELLQSLAAARIRKDGPSRVALNLKSNDLPPLKNFKFSYNLPGCPQPHIFSPSEACDLLSSFGGVFLRGDSLMRHLSQGLFALLSNSLDILWSVPERYGCKGSTVFSGKMCRYAAKYDVREIELARKFCAKGEVPPVRYEQVMAWEPRPHPHPEQTLSPHGHGPKKKKPHPREQVKREREARGSSGLAKRAEDSTELEAEARLFSPALQRLFKHFVASLSPARQTLSPVYIHGTGIHYHFNSALSAEYHVKPFAHTAAEADPRPVALWVMHPAPGPNKLAQFQKSQGRTPTMRYNVEMNRILADASQGETEVAKGAWGALDYYNTTEGAYSFDGTHYGYQVTMERAQMLLNYLDVLWGEIVDLGGLVQ